MKKSTLAAILTSAVLTAIPVVAFASVSNDIPWADVQTYISDTTDTWYFPNQDTPYFKCVQWAYSNSDGSSQPPDMVYNVYNTNGSVGYAAEVYGTYKSSDAYAYWGVVQGGWYKLTIYDAAYWDYKTASSNSDYGNGYVYY